MEEKESRQNVRSRIIPGQPVNPDSPVIPETDVVFTPYNNPAGSEYPVIAYNNAEIRAGEQNKILPLLQTVKDCGFNVNIWENSVAQAEQLLHANFQAAQSLGLKTILSVCGFMPYVTDEYLGTSNARFLFRIYYVPSLTDGLQMILGKYVDEDNLWGYFLMDQPSFNDMEYDLRTQKVGKLNFTPAYNTYILNAHKKNAFFNLAVSADKSTVGEEIAAASNSKKTVYARFLEYVYKKYRPVMLSVDVYPIIDHYDGQDENSQGYVIKDHYYYSLEAIGEFSKNKNIPFWMLLLSNRHTIYREDGSVQAAYPYPTEGILRYQAMNALAFGFQGIVFWTYSLSPSQIEYKPDPPKGTVFYDAPYLDGKTTPIWDNCKVVIAEILQYGKVLLDAKFQEARHVYGPTATSEFKETTKFTSSSKIGCVIEASASGRGFVITRLKRSNTTYLAVVSHDAYEEQDVSLTLLLRSNWNWRIVSLENTSNATYSEEDKPQKEVVDSMVLRTIKRRLSPGGILLIEYIIPAVP